MVPKSHDKLVKIFRFTIHVEGNKVHYASLKSLNIYVRFPKFPDVWLSRKRKRLDKKPKFSLEMGFFIVFPIESQPLFFFPSSDIITCIS